MKSLIQQLLRENLQQADKIYFKTGKLPAEVRNYVLDITQNDPYGKWIADFFFQMTRHGQNVDKGLLEMAEKLHYNMVNYDKNVLPLQSDFSKYDAENNGPYNIIDLYGCLEWRNVAVRRLKELPSIILRNLKPTLRKPEDNEYAFKTIAEDVGELRDALKTLPKDE
jgi:hypothetical protein